MSSRLPAVKGERIDRATAVEFTFEGRRVSGFHGDTISSALTAEGVRILGRSFQIPSAARPVECRRTRCQRNDAGP